MDQRLISGRSIDRNAVADLCRENDIAFLGVFGSHAHGTATAESDLDLLVRFSKRKSLLDLVRIERQLAERLKMSVDLVTESALSPYIRQRVLAEVRELYVHREG